MNTISFTIFRNAHAKNRTWFITFDPYLTQKWHFHTKYVEFYMKMAKFWPKMTDLNPNWLFFTQKWPILTKKERFRPILIKNDQFWIEIDRFGSKITENSPKSPTITENDWFDTILTNFQSKIVLFNLLWHGNDNSVERIWTLIVNAFVLTIYFRKNAVMLKKCMLLRQSMSVLRFGRISRHCSNHLIKRLRKIWYCFESNCPILESAKFLLLGQNSFKLIKSNTRTQNWWRLECIPQLLITSWKQISPRSKEPQVSLMIKSWLTNFICFWPINLNWLIEFAILIVSMEVQNK